MILIHLHSDPHLKVNEKKTGYSIGKTIWQCRLKWSTKDKKLSRMGKIVKKFIKKTVKKYIYNKQNILLFVDQSYH